MQGASRAGDERQGEERIGDRRPQGDPEQPVLAHQGEGQDQVPEAHGHQSEAGSAGVASSEQDREGHAAHGQEEQERGHQHLQEASGGRVVLGPEPPGQELRAEHEQVATEGRDEERGHLRPVVQQAHELALAPLHAQGRRRGHDDHPDGEQQVHERVEDLVRHAIGGDILWGHVRSDHQRVELEGEQCAHVHQEGEQAEAQQGADLGPHESPGSEPNGWMASARHREGRDELEGRDQYVDPGQGQQVRPPGEGPDGGPEPQQHPGAHHLVLGDEVLVRLEGRVRQSQAEAGGEVRQVDGQGGSSVEHLGRGEGPALALQEGLLEPGPDPGSHGQCRRRHAQGQAHALPKGTVGAVRIPAAKGLAHPSHGPHGDAQDEQLQRAGRGNDRLPDAEGPLAQGGQREPRQGHEDQDLEGVEGPIGGDALEHGWVSYFGSPGVRR